jgi:hypothetical protein
LSASSHLVIWFQLALVWSTKLYTPRSDRAELSASPHYGDHRLYERWQPPRPGRLDLAAVLAQLGRNPRQPDGLEDLRVGFPPICRLPRKMPYSLIFSRRLTLSRRTAILCAFDPVK